MAKNLATNAGDSSLTFALERFPGEGNGNSLQVFLPGESFGLRSLENYCPQGCKELDTTYRLNNNMRS